MRNTPFNADSVRALVADTKVAKNIQSVDVSTLTPEIWAKAADYARAYDKPDPSLKKGMRCFFAWVHALGALHAARRAFEPSAERVSAMRLEKETLRTALEAKKAEVERVSDHLTLLRSMHRAAVRRT
jgi:hypothetical protein